MPLKAYKAWIGPWPPEWVVLVYARSRNEARQRVRACTDDSDWGSPEYIDTRARRVPAYDVYAVGDMAYEIHSNLSLPAGAPPFYTYEELEYS